MTALRIAAAIPACIAAAWVATCIVLARREPATECGCPFCDVWDDE